MLVLSRKVGQKITIGDNITLTIVKISGNRVQLGIDAPLEISIRREEVQKCKHKSLELPMEPLKVFTA